MKLAMDLYNIADEKIEQCCDYSVLLSEVNNPNNESAAEPIMSIKKYNTLINNTNQYDEAVASFIDEYVEK